LAILGGFTVVFSTIGSGRSRDFKIRPQRR
jgi:hypothetical protein